MVFGTLWRRGEGYTEAYLPPPKTPKLVIREVLPRRGEQSSFSAERFSTEPFRWVDASWPLAA